MKWNEILKAKTQNEIIEDFCERNKINYRDMKDFMMDFITLNPLKIWVVSIFIWMFGLSMIINGIMALHGHYFWFPINKTESMLAFFNIFWAILWFTFAITIIVVRIIKVVKFYE